MALGLGSGLPFTRGEGGIPPVTVTSESLKFPESNGKESTANYSYLRIPRTGIHSNGIFGPNARAAALVFGIEIPWEKVYKYNSGNYSGETITHGLFGNGITAQAIAIRLWSRDSSGTSAGNAGKITVDWRPNGLVAGIQLAIDPVTDGASIDAIRKGILVFRRDSSAATGDNNTDTAAKILLEFYSNGSLISSASTTMDMSGNGFLRSDVCLGALGNYTQTPVAPTASGVGGAWCGSIGFFGVYKGAAVPTQSDWEAISNGVDAQTQISTGWDYIFEFSDPDTASITPTVDVQTSGNATLVESGDNVEKGGSIFPAASGADRFSTHPIADGYVFGRAPSASSGTVTLSGVATSLTGNVEARCYQTDGTVLKDWTALTGVSLAGGTDEAWSGTFSVPKGSGWSYFDVRPAADETLTQAIRNRSGVGIKAVILGQSQIVIASQTSIGVVSHSNNGPLSRFDRASNGETTLDVCNSSTWELSGAFSAMANHLGGLSSSEPVCFIVEAESGTGIDHFVDDSDATRNWSDFTGTLAISGDDVSCLVINWGTNFMGDADGVDAMIDAHLKPLFAGTTPDPNNYTVDHYLEDGTLPATVAFAISPLTRHTQSTATYGQNAAAARAEYISYANTRGWTVGPFVDDYPTGSGNSPAFGPHPEEDVAEGNPRFGVRLLVAALRACGVDSSTNPSIASLESPATDELNITVTLPNGGTLQTQWEFDSASPPGGEDSIQGFEISTDGGTTWSENGFSTSKSGAVVTLTKDSGNWSGQTVHVRYLKRGPIDYNDAAGDNELLKGMLYEALSVYEDGLGLPVAGLWEDSIVIA